jgi:HAD superfamily hydrolase (TIGR01509 family)
MRYLGIIFDFNGVLWWDRHLQEKAWIQFAGELDGRSLPGEAIAHQVHGRNNRDTLAYLTGSTHDKMSLQQLSDRKETIYRDLCLAQGADFKLAPGVIELLDSLVAHEIPRTIATASGKKNLDFFVEHLDLDKWFDIDRIVYDDGLRPGKPAADIFIQAARVLDLNPASCVVVEGSFSGIRAAHAADIGYIIVLGAEDQHAHLINLDGVNQVVASLAQVHWKHLFL